MTAGISASLLESGTALGYSPRVGIAVFVVKRLNPLSSLSLRELVRIGSLSTYTNSALLLLCVGRCKAFHNKVEMILP